VDDLIGRLEHWYASQCEDDDVPGTPWQHRYGISINTSDNPAWNVVIDLEGTDLENVMIPQVQVENGDSDWYRCQIVDGRFGGVGDPLKLGVILRWFLDVAEANPSIRPE
jgi:hypothetical protein